MSTLGKGLDVQKVAVDLLQTIITHWAAATSLDVVPLPTRRAVVPGDPRTIAWDCEQLTVSMVGIGYGQALDEASPSRRAGSPTSVSGLRHAILAVTLVRCTPVGKEDGTPPTVAELDAAGRVFFRDCGMISQALMTYCSDVRKHLSSAESVQAGAVDPVGPSGGYHGIETTLAITLGNLV